MMISSPVRLNCSIASTPLLIAADTLGPIRRQHDVVISEIMWALDDAEAQADLHLKQWIELVNTTADADEHDTAAARESCDTEWSWSSASH